MKATLQRILDHHDALRLRVSRSWELEIGAVGSVKAAECLKRVEVEEEESLGGKIRAEWVEAAKKAESGTRSDGADGVVRPWEEGNGKAVAAGASSGGGWGVVEDTGAGFEGGVGGSAGGKEKGVEQGDVV